MTKGQLMDAVLTEVELRNCDPAIPDSLFKELQDLGLMPHGRFVMMYTDNSLGKLVDLFERFYMLFGEALPELQAAAIYLLKSCQDRGDAYYDEETHEGKSGMMIPEFDRLFHAIENVRKQIATHKGIEYVPFENI